MNDIDSVALRVRDNQLLLLDQQQLPQREIWLQPTSAAELVAIIRQMQIRGAPLIGIAAALMLATLATRGFRGDALRREAALLRAARPTAVNLQHCVDRVLRCDLNDADAVSRCARDLFAEDVALCDAIATHGLELLGARESILTICNTGALATAGIGTALGVIRRAVESGRPTRIFALETRPLLQGGRLTAWELEQMGADYTLLPDAAAGALLQSGQVSRVLVGADRIAVNGDTANKVGTYSLAVLSQRHRVPFHVVAPRTTVDPRCPDGASIEIEQRDAAEVRGVRGGFGSVEWSTASATAFNPAFDVTPAELVTSWILDSGIYAPADVSAGALRGLSVGDEGVA